MCKAAADSSAGWYAVVNGQKNIGLVENFKYFPDQEYPDGASVETWNDGPGTFSRGPFDQTLEDGPEKTPYFLESEGMSPYARLEPGEEYSYPIYWSPTRVPYPISSDPTSGGMIERTPYRKTRRNHGYAERHVWSVLARNFAGGIFQRHG